MRNEGGGADGIIAQIRRTDLCDVFRNQPHLHELNRTWPPVALIKKILPRSYFDYSNIYYQIANMVEGDAKGDQDFRFQISGFRISLLSSSASRISNYAIPLLRLYYNMFVLNHLLDAVPYQR